MAKFDLLNSIRSQFISLPLVQANLTGRVIIVVGANVGLGLEAARHLASMNPGRLILACRSVEKGEAALKDIKESTGCKTLEVWQIDLASFASVKSFVDRFEKEGGGKLDLLVENAGISTRNFLPTSDKYERTLQTNHLSTALLSILLLPYLSKSTVTSPGPRTVIVSSEIHFAVSRLTGADKDNIIDAFNDPSTAKMAARYHESKLLNVFFTRAFGQHLKEDCPVAIDCLNPGLCHSQLTRDAAGFIKVLGVIIKALFARSTEMGSRTIIHAALGESSQSAVQGRYLNNCQVAEESDYAIGEEGAKIQRRLWDETITLLKGVDPRVGGIVDQYLTKD